LALTIGVEKLFKQLDLGGSIGAICKSPIWVVFKALEIQHNRISKGICFQVVVCSATILAVLSF
jgi:hypothetical protein